MRRDLRGLAALATAALAIHLALIQPNHPDAATWGAFRLFPLELPAILLALLLARGAAARVLRAAVAAFLALTVVLKAADLASNAAFGRLFNPVLDLHLAPAAWRLLSGAVGVPLALAAGLALLLGLALAARALWWATGRLAAAEAPPRARAPLGLALGLAALVAVADAARELSPLNPPGAAFSARLAWEHGRDIRRARADLAAFRLEVAQDPTADLPPDEILAALRGTDVFVIFVESYGRAALDSPRFAPRARATLAEIETRLAAAGLAMRSGYLASPIVGGQSWLAHASLQSGLRIDGEGRYRALFASQRRTLNGLAGAAGWRSVAVMPAITLAWPEAEWFGYDRVLAAGDLGYAGLPFGWVTMPDQFALAAFERAELDPAPRAPVFAEVALVSSHAPWTPLPPLLPWEALGDGAVFDQAATAGPSAEEVWSDLDRVRDHYARALDYSLRTVGGFAERRAAAAQPRPAATLVAAAAVAAPADGAPLIVVLGDHQPATFITLDEVGRDVPIHVIGAPRDIARLDAWGWTRGLIPAAGAPVWGMEAFRDRFLAAFGPTEAARCSGAGALPALAGC